MDKLDRARRLEKELINRRHPVSGALLCERLDCSRSSFQRLLAQLRDEGAAIDYCRERQGYYLSKQPEDGYIATGLWFSADELLALLTSHKLLLDIQTGWLEEYIQPINQKLKKLLSKNGLNYQEVQQRVKILQLAARPTNIEYFQTLVSGLIKRQQIKILYHGRARDKNTERTVSPQRLIYYRSNWYLDAWCHKKQALRTFSLDRLQPVDVTNIAAKEISEQQLKQHFTKTYGIFAGDANKIAELRFSGHAAKWVADEQWHPEQKSKVLPDGALQMEIPYGNPKELIMDILKYGPNVKVIKPAGLRKQIQQQLQAALKHYE